MGTRWFESATPESVGISSTAICNMLDKIDHTPESEYHGFTIIRHRKIVAEGNYFPFKDEPHVIHSCTKAFTATAIGFAIKEGLLSLNDPIIQYLSDLAPQNPSEEAKSLTIKDLLIMANGHKASAFLRPYGEIAPLELKKRFMSSDFSTKPGTTFAYNNANSYMLTEIIKRVSKMDLIDYLRPRLLDKLGINPYYNTDDEGMFVGFGTMRMTMEELARFGQFYMDKCVWEGEPLLSEEWADEATRYHISTLGENPDSSKLESPDWNQGYAFHIWRGQHNSFRFCGAHGQICACYPDYDTILCVTSGSSIKIQKILNAFYENVLIHLQDKLPENPEAFRKLQKKCDSLSLPVHFSRPSPIISKINSKEWAISDCGEILSVKLDFSDQECHIKLGFQNGDTFIFNAGTKSIIETPCPDTHIVSLQPKDNAVCAASLEWINYKELSVTAHMLPTHTMFQLYFTFEEDSCLLKAKMFRGYEFGTRK